MPQFHPILYSLPDGWALGKTVEASDADEACPKAAATMLELTLVEAEEMFTKLMGEEVEPRRQFIEDNALNVRNLDI